MLYKVKYYSRPSSELVSKLKDNDNYLYIYNIVIKCYLN